jgi:hypothetical protein
LDFGMNPLVNPCDQYLGNAGYASTVRKAGHAGAVRRAGHAGAVRRAGHASADKTH